MALEMRAMTVRIVVGDVQMLKSVAATAARLGNEVLSYLYCEGRRYSAAKRAGIDLEEDKDKLKFIPSDENWGPLSGNLRDTIKSEARDIWMRFQKQILAGYRTLPLFDANRALRLRDKAAKIIRVGDWYELSLQLYPGRENNWVNFPISKFTEMKKGEYVLPWLADVADGRIKIAKTSIRFNRKKVNLVLVRFSYLKELDDVEAASRPRTARFGDVGEDGKVYIRTDGPAYNFSERKRLKSLTQLVQRIQTMKRSKEGMFRRLRMSGQYRKMREISTFEDSSSGPRHELSRAIVDFCKQRRITDLEWQVKADDGDFPWAEIFNQVKYKGREIGLNVVESKEFSVTTKGEEQWVRQQKKATREQKKALRMALQT